VATIHDERQGTKRELVVHLVGPKVDEGQRSMVGSTRKMTAEDSGSQCR
jgi:hypothetical protein